MHYKKFLENLKTMRFPPGTLLVEAVEIMEKSEVKDMRIIEDGRFETEVLGHKVKIVADTEVEAELYAIQMANDLRD